METVLQDLKQAVRGLGKNTGALVTAVLTLAVGIGFSTATFSVTNAVLLRPLPYDEPSRLVNLSEQVPPRTIQFAVSPPHYLFWRDHATAFEGIGAWQSVQVNFQSGGEDPQRVHADRVTANLFAILRVAPALGRAFLPSDDESGAQKVALLSHGTWQRRFGGARDVVGQTIRVDQQPATIVGVMPPGFAFPRPRPSCGCPRPSPPPSAAPTAAISCPRSAGSLRGSPARAQADLKDVSARLGEVNPASAGWEVQLTDLRDDTVQDVRRSLLVLAGAVALVLFIACVNVANLLLVGGAARHRELAIRTAIGATRGRLLRQLVVEHAALAAISASTGVLLAAWLLRALLRLVPDALPRQGTIGIDGEVLAFAHRARGADTAALRADPGAGGFAARRPPAARGRWTSGWRHSRPAPPDRSGRGRNGPRHGAPRRRRAPHPQLRQADRRAARARSRTRDRHESQPAGRRLPVRRAARAFPARVPRAGAGAARTWPPSAWRCRCRWSTRSAAASRSRGNRCRAISAPSSTSLPSAPATSPLRARRS